MKVIFLEYVLHAVLKQHSSINVICIMQMMQDLISLYLYR